MYDLFDYTFDTMNGRVVVSHGINVEYCLPRGLSSNLEDCHGNVIATFSIQNSNVDIEMHPVVDSELGNIPIGIDEMRNRYASLGGLNRNTSIDYDPSVTKNRQRLFRLQSDQTNGSFLNNVLLLYDISNPLMPELYAKISYNSVVIKCMRFKDAREVGKLVKDVFSTPFDKEPRTIAKNGDHENNESASGTGLSHSSSETTTNESKARGSDRAKNKSQYPTQMRIIDDEDQELFISVLVAIQVMQWTMLPSPTSSCTVQ
jgi:hypothetical protein